ncbi:class I SAM-dependent methyltransferase [Rhodovulum tesquicola]|uniref:class I SAM-dependent methyltransferase n=1 Tax=Rhodovulum tesquicola TaxID=540254 RepID=UPI0020968F4B|nr:class I SAM-dependent methyltransferase [Rhodovulum tesquicola]MCO8146791.1 class I SAM-dependent methyltransferase [Rhodovulum tesquicola]
MTALPDPETRDLFDAAPWAALAQAELGAAAGVPTMLDAGEQRLYLWLARNWARGAGAIVDLGCFAGGSTARLAEGRRQAGHRTSIHAFDRFTASEELKARMLYPAGIPPFAGGNILPLVRRLLSPWDALVTLHPGEIADQHWSDGPIEILAIDAAKSDAMADTIAARFLPGLIPGGSVVIQQDYFHWRQPWLAAQMARLADCFVPLAVCPPTSAVFLCTRAPDADMLARAACTGLDDAALATGLAAARAQMARFGQAARFDRLAAALAANPGGRVAWRMRKP